jgi:hypothetical protein
MRDSMNIKYKWFIARLWLIAIILIIALTGYTGLYLMKLHVELESMQIELESSRADADLANENNKILIRELLLAEIGSDANIIIGLRDYVYNKTILGKGNIEQFNPVSQIIKLKNSKANMMCGGMAFTYKSLLSAFDIPARTIQLATKEYIDGYRRNDTHVTVEVYDSKMGKWYLSDPTFNISLMCNNKKQLADIEELRECAINGQGISYVRDGVQYIKGRTIEEYYLPYSDLLYAVDAEKTIGLVNGNPIIRHRAELPSNNWRKTALGQYDN